MEDRMDLGDKNKDDIKEPTFKETCDMLKELKNREGVTAIETGPYSKFKVTVDGPATLLIVYD